MYGRNTRARRGPLTIAVLSAAALLFTQGTASAASGNWYLQPSGTHVPGSRVSLTPRVLCDQGPCTYDTDWRLTVSALSDAEFLNEVGSSFALVKGRDGTHAGTCTVDSPTEVRCAAQGTGSVGTGDDLRLARELVLRTASSSCRATAEVFWFEVGGTEDAGPDDDTTTHVTDGRCE
ncbi:hypothetical protein [Streptomyces sp. NBC_01565]|uniref:hypothetical protein n=1 Tax=Streptomyces sp. NBC_01565 TaxID=2975881 RepID=UPI002254BB46|nr:hypothetical protein [Streptomyces sp. NBC_01565]MCX4546692.1 hypothetical protein [Streptomyces sp. NBC_01565]